jgi:hypothetical protein
MLAFASIACAASRSTSYGRGSTKSKLFGATNFKRSSPMRRANTAKRHRATKSRAHRSVASDADRRRDFAGQTRPPRLKLASAALASTARRTRGHAETYGATNPGGRRSQGSRPDGGRSRSPGGRSRHGRRPASPGGGVTMSVPPSVVSPPLPPLPPPPGPVSARPLSCIGVPPEPPAPPVPLRGLSSSHAARSATRRSGQKRTLRPCRISISPTLRRPPRVR